MLAHTSKKEKAITLRREGKTYSEILKQVPVAKSTLSEWFRDVKLSKPEFQRLTAKKLAAAKRGGEAKHRQRLERMQKIRMEALKDITHISKRELWLIGTVLYWAEGSKEKDFHPGSGVIFSNSDPRMIQLFIAWLLKCLSVAKERLYFELTIHENSKNTVFQAQEFWSKVCNFPLENFNKVYFKKGNIKTKRRNIGNLYYGQLRVRVRESSTLLRQIAGWTEAIVNHVK